MSHGLTSSPPSAAGTSERTGHGLLASWTIGIGLCLTTDGRLCHHLQISRGGVAALWNGRNRARVCVCVCVCPL